MATKLLVLVVLIQGMCALKFGYHRHAELTYILENFTATYPKVLPKLYSIGKSKQGRDLWVVEATATNESIIGVPNVKLIGNIHGNEAVGRELLLHLLEFLGENYGSDSEVTWLLDNTRIHVLPSMNPDGFEKANEGLCAGEYGRGNANNVDLNRSFPDLYYHNSLMDQAESRAVRKWMNDTPFILSGSLHGGALVANYPFDTVEEMKWERLLRQLKETDDPVEQQKLRDTYIEHLLTNEPSMSPDDDVFVHLASVYAKRHPTMHLGKSCSDSEVMFEGGITNGAAWYPFKGGMQDYNYFAHGCMELTLEISCCKYPRARRLRSFWEDNRPALLDFVKQAHMGVRGTVFDKYTGKKINSATLKVAGREMNFTTSRNGEFWRILLPGNYTLMVFANGYHPQNVSFEVPADSKPPLSILRIALLNETLPNPTTTYVSSTTTYTTSTKDARPPQKNLLQNNCSSYHCDSIEEPPLKLENVQLGKLGSAAAPNISKLVFSEAVIISFLLIIVYLN